ncbi:hypothetical protein [Paenibacillus cellulositrophicus]|uniref:hypothetical protein n=1 Tax=Paenibacillus cellulositrophicus TaxID=562959 RepID=UPI001FCB96F0|nr:hypothetical protein [Paenibacillus cellulositrophicus]
MIDQQEYGKYVLGLMDEDEAEETVGPIEEEMFYGYFQIYMPSGKGVEATFAPLEDGDIFLQRILPIYEMLDPQDFQGEWVPGYFNGKSDHVSEEELRDLGKRHILALKQLMDDHAELEEAVEASAYLGTVSEVVIVSGSEFEKFREEYDPVVHESLFELVSEHTDDQEPVQMLSEAYYSIACDYWISYYLQWHRYGLKGDPLAPYFELYKLGYSAIFANGKLYIGKP